MIARHLASRIRQMSEKMPVVTLTGPRQSGKTTLVRACFPNHDYVSLERPDERAAALSDPLGFLGRFREGVIIDEVQRAPDLLSYIQVAVDEDHRPGRFVLTGSQNLLLGQAVSQSLAGRTSLLTLLPLSLSELWGRPPLAPERLDEAPDALAAPKEADPWRTVFSGFYPRIHDQGLEPTAWLADYFHTYVERDLRDVLRVMDVDAFERFVRLCATRTATELNLSSLASDAGVTQPTARQWITALRLGSLVMLLQPHHASFRKRLRKRPKLHFLDSGLACYLLGIGSSEVLARHPLRGAVFESYVVAEIAKAFVHAGREAPLYHWRDATGHEVDLVVDLGDRLIPVEIKSGVTVTSDAVLGLVRWTSLLGNPNRTGALVHGGAAGYRRGTFAVRPWHLG